LAVAASLTQPDDEGHQHPVAYESRKLTVAERNYPAHVLELLAVVHALRVFKHYLLGSGAPRPAGCGSDFDLRTDNQAITWLKTNKHLNKMYIRWLDEIENGTSASMSRISRARGIRRTHCRVGALRMVLGRRCRQGIQTRRVSRSCFHGWGATRRQPLCSPPFTPGGTPPASQQLSSWPPFRGGNVLPPTPGGRRYSPRVLICLLPWQGHSWT
jgi:RNase P subunit RPR2